MPRGLSVKKSYPHIEHQSAVFWHTMPSARATLSWPARWAGDCWVLPEEMCTAGELQRADISVAQHFHIPTNFLSSWQADVRCCMKCTTFVAPNFIAYVQSERKGKSGISVFHFAPFLFFLLLSNILFFFCASFFYLFVYFFLSLPYSSLFCFVHLLSFFSFTPTLCVPCLFFLFILFFTSSILVSVFLSLFAFSSLHTFLLRCASYVWDGSELVKAADTRRLWDRMLHIIA